MRPRSCRAPQIRRGEGPVRESGLRCSTPVSRRPLRWEAPASRPIYLAHETPFYLTIDRRRCYTSRRCRSDAAWLSADLREGSSFACGAPSHVSCWRRWIGWDASWAFRCGPRETEYKPAGVTSVSPCAAAKHRFPNTNLRTRWRISNGQSRFPFLLSFSSF